MAPHPCPQHRFEATQMLKTIGLEQIQAQELEGLTFELLRRKIFNEPFLVSETKAPKPKQPKAVSLPSQTSPVLIPTTPSPKESHSL